jgi:perosamine synthetase
MKLPIAKPLIGEEEKEAVGEVLKSGVIAQGPKVREFEGAFANFCGTKYAVAASSGTTALHLALLATEIVSGDEVITTPFTFIATANSILYCGAKPVFADIDSQTFNIDPFEVEKKITDNTKAVLVVHLYGHPCEMDSITKICEENNLRLIEDACQAHGASIKGRKVGGLGDCGVFSFYPTKNMTTGEGGMLTTNNALIAEKARLLREHGSNIRYHHQRLGYNYRMTDIAAAIGLAQLKKLEYFNKKRIENSRRLTDALSGIKGVIPPLVKPGVKHVFHQYTIRVKEDFHLSRDKAVKRLNEKGIGTGVYYPVPIHKQPYFKDDYDDLKRSEEASITVLSLPVHPGISDVDLDYICKTLQEL